MQLLRYGMVWYGMVWYGMVWLPYYGMVWFGRVHGGGEIAGVITIPTSSFIQTLSFRGRTYTQNGHNKSFPKTHGI